MGISMITVTVYFVGIAAVVNVPPQNNVTKSVIFPMSQNGGQYMDTPLEPHQTWLYLRNKDLAEADEDFCARIGGQDSSVGCSVPLNGARVWIQTSDPLTEDEYFRKIPSFLNYCRTARNLAAGYADVNSEFVAARFDIRGGSMSGCNRNGVAFVTSLTTKSNDGVLYVDQNERTVRVVLKEGALVTIENKAVSASHSNMEMSHFGWYYAMNVRPNEIGKAADLCPIATPKVVAGIMDCPFTIPGTTDGLLGAASADCSNSNYP